MQQPVAQCLGLGLGQSTVQEQVLGRGEQTTASMVTVSRAWLIEKLRDGKWVRPVSFAPRIRSSTRACARWRASRWASCPKAVSVANAV
jgi:hypothetical protein